VEAGDDTRAIGRRFFVMRRFETLDGHVLAEGAALARNTAVRVRVFLVAEQGSYEAVRVNIPDFGGVSARNERSSLEMELETILGAPLCYGVTDPRTSIAERTLPFIRERNVTAGSNVFTFQSLPAGLHELTYVVRTSIAGRFAAPPATFMGADGETWARSAIGHLEVLP
jgi:hypothetical protein